MSVSDVAGQYPWNVSNDVIDYVRIEKETSGHVDAFGTTDVANPGVRVSDRRFLQAVVVVALERGPRELVVALLPWNECLLSPC